MEHPTCYFTQIRFQQSKDFIERQGQTIKKIIKKYKKEKKDIHIAMLDLQATPVDSKRPSAAEIFMGRPITTLPAASPYPTTLAQRQHLEHRRSTTKFNCDRHAGESLSSLQWADL